MTEQEKKLLEEHLSKFMSSELSCVDRETRDMITSAYMAGAEDALENINKWKDTDIELPPYHGNEPAGESDCVIFCTDCCLYVGTFDWDIGMWHTSDQTIKRERVKYWMAPHIPERKKDLYIAIKERNS